MRLNAVFLAVSLILMHSSMAEAGEPVVTRTAGDMAAGVIVSTSGIGPELAWWPSARWALRADTAFFYLDRKFGIAGVQYNGDARLASVGGTVDYFPWDDRGWRVSVGGRANFTELRAKGRARELVRVGQIALTPEELGLVKGKAWFPRAAPYAGIGFTGPVGNEGWLSVLDIGLLYQGKPRVRLSADGPVTDDPRFQPVIEMEERRLVKELKNLAFYPAVKLGMLYHF